MTFITSALPPELVPYAQDLEEFGIKTGIRLSLPPLGIGGGGTVLKAENKYGKHLAVKVIAAGDAASRDQALREASILKQVQRVKAYGGGEGLLWQKQYQHIHLFILGLEYIPGQTLTELLLAKGPLDEAAAIELAIGIARELEALHTRNIIHRDVKPDNIMLLKVGNGYQPVVVDYGIAKVGNNRTWLGARAATDGYAPPEQYTGGTDRRADIYALGATLYEMVTGLTPLAAINRAPHHVLEPSQYHPKLSLELEQVIQIATAYDAQQRFATMGALIDALRLVEDGNAVALWSTLQALGLLGDGNSPLDSIALSLASVPALPPLPPAVGVAGNLVPRTPSPQFLSLLFAQQILLGGPALGWMGKRLLVLAYWLLLTSIALGARSLSITCSLVGGLTMGCLVCFLLLFPVFAQVLLSLDKTVITRRGQAHWLRRSAVLLLGLGGLAGMFYWLVGEVVAWQLAWMLTPPPISILVYMGLACFAGVVLQALLA